MGIERLYYWAWCLGPMDSQNRPTNLIQGWYSYDREGLLKLNSDIARIYPQGDWKIEELPTTDRNRATAMLRHKVAYAQGNLVQAMKRFYSKPRGGLSHEANQDHQNVRRQEV